METPTIIFIMVWVIFGGMVYNATYLRQKKLDKKHAKNVFEKNDIVKILQTNKWDKEHRMNWTSEHYFATKDKERFFSTVQRNWLLHYHHGKCACCGTSNDLQFDHVIPHSAGGKTSTLNGQVLCRRCNKVKSAHILTIDELREMVSL